MKIYFKGWKWHQNYSNLKFKFNGKIKILLGTIRQFLKNNFLNKNASIASKKP